MKIIADSSCDIKSLEGVDFVAVPLKIYTDERSFTDDENLNVPEMLEYLENYKGRSYTSCPDVDGWLQAIGDSEETYIVAMTSGLSGTYNSAKCAADMYLETHPAAKIVVFDTLSTAGEMLLIIDKIKCLKEAGASFEDVCEEIAAYSKTTRLFFALQSLHNFSQNGRIPKVLAQAIGILGICIIGTASEHGTVAPIGKSRGKKAIISTMMEQIKKAGYSGGKIKIGHIENEDLANAFAEEVKKAYPDAEMSVYASKGLCAYYAERGSLLVGCECK